MMLMTTPEVLYNIVRNGNKILVVGGGFAKLQLDHPKILVWDDEVTGFDTKQIPITVKAILWGRNISHETTNKLNMEIRRLHALKFPMLRPNEVRNLLSLVVDKPAPVVNEVVEVVTEPVVTEPITQEPLTEQVEDTTMAKNAGRNELKNFLIKNLKLDVDYSVRGSVSQEAGRLFKMASTAGIKTTKGSVVQAVSKILREMKTNKSKPVAPAKSKAETNDFAELKRLIGDAQAALKLVAEHMHKVEKEVESARSARARLLKILEG